jgi:hypothetical protein
MDLSQHVITGAAYSGETTAAHRPLMREELRAPPVRSHRPGHSAPASHTPDVLQRFRRYMVTKVRRSVAKYKYAGCGERRVCVS